MDSLAIGTHERCTGAPDIRPLLTGSHRPERGSQSSRYFLEKGGSRLRLSAMLGSKADYHQAAYRLLRFILLLDGQGTDNLSF